MQEALFLVLEVVLCGLIAVGVGVELGYGWGLVVGGVLGLPLVVAAQRAPVRRRGDV
jgi:hypothetical protein